MVSRWNQNPIATRSGTCETDPILRFSDLPEQTEDLGENAMAGVAGGAIVAPSDGILPTVLGVNLNTTLPGSGNLTIGYALWTAGISVAVTYGPDLVRWGWDKGVSAAKSFIDWVDEIDPPEVYADRT
jgi:hypothetical protein